MKKLAFTVVLISLTVLFIYLIKGEDQQSLALDQGLPATFDLRQLGLAPAVKEQAWGTCWIFATYLGMESNLMRTGNWSEIEEGEPHLAPYHLDKYSGFTRRGDDSHVNDTWYSGQGARYRGSNTDDLTSGLIVHLGGDFKASTAFLTNTLGAVQQRLTPTIPRSGDHELFGDLETEGVLKENNYSYFFPRNVRWLTLEGSEEEKRRAIKEAIMTYGAVASSQVMDDWPLGIAPDGLEIHGSLDPDEPLNHAINLIGWNDDIVFEGHRGAWLAQDSDHRTEDDEPLGHFYVLYDDVYAAKDPWMGGVLYKDVTIAPFKYVYSHALHGLRYHTHGEDKIERVANRFRMRSDEQFVGVGFYTVKKNTAYRIQLVTSLQDKEPLWEREGVKRWPGFHFLEKELKEELSLRAGQVLYVVLGLSNREYAYDASATIEVLLGGAGLPEWGEPIQLNSRANPEEGFYWDQTGTWRDFASFISRSNAQKDNDHAVNNPTASLALNLYTK